MAEELDCILPAEAVDTSASGMGNFPQHYGFRDKPVRIRFRLPDPGRALPPTGTDQDFAVTQDTFARLDPGIAGVHHRERG